MPFKNVPGENDKDRKERLQRWVDGDEWKLEYAAKHPENIPDVYERGDVNFDPDKFGFDKVALLPHEERLEMFGAGKPLPLGLVEPPTGEWEAWTGYEDVPHDYKIAGQNLGSWYSQVGGTCGGYSGAQGGTDDYAKYPNIVPVFSGMDMYKACREAGGVNPNDINGGILMQWLAKALTDKGRMPLGADGKWTTRQKQYGASTVYWGANYKDVARVIYNSMLAYKGQATTPIMGCQIGIPIYQSFMSLKSVVIGGKTYYFVYWQSGSWGGFLGGHAMRPTGYTTKVRYGTSVGSIILPGTWFDDGFPEVLMPVEAFTRCLNGDGELLIAEAIPQGSPPPMGKLELAEPFSIAPLAPAKGDTVTMHFKVKNTGDAPLTGHALAIEELLDGQGTDGFVGSDFDIAPGQTYEINPIHPPVVAGTYRWWPDYRNSSGRFFHMGDPLTVTVPDAPPPPPPPPPPPTSTKTLDFNEIEIDGKKYTSKKRYPDGVVLDEV